MGYSNAIAGNQLKMYVNGALYGLVVSAVWNISPGWREVRGLDEPMPVELAPASYRVGGTFEVLRGRWDRGLERAGFMAIPTQFTRQKYVQLQLLDRVDDSLVLEAPRAQILDATWRISPKQLVVGNVTWVAQAYGSRIGQL